MYMKYDNGTSESMDEVADRILAEPYGLTTGAFLNIRGTRCAIGVIEDWQARKDFGHQGYPRRQRIESGFNMLYARRYSRGLMFDNDLFRGTNLERAKYIANRIRVLE